MACQAAIGFRLYCQRLSQEMAEAASTQLRSVTDHGLMRRREHTTPLTSRQMGNYGFAMMPPWLAEHADLIWKCSATNAISVATVRVRDRTTKTVDKA